MSEPPKPPLHVYVRQEAPTGYYCSMRSYNTTDAEVKEFEQFHGRIASWRLTVIGTGTMGLGQGRNANDALNNLALTFRESESDPGYMSISVSANGTKVLVEIWYWED